MRNAAVSSANFHHFPIMSCSREKIPGSPCFSVLQATESLAGPGNEAKCKLLAYKLWEPSNKRSKFDLQAMRTNSNLEPSLPPLGGGVAGVAQH